MNRSAGNISNRAGVWSRFPLQTLAAVGSFACTRWDELRHAAAVIGTVFLAAVHPRSWTAPVRKALAQQILTAGVEPVGFPNRTPITARQGPRVPTWISTKL